MRNPDKKNFYILDDEYGYLIDKKNIINEEMEKEYKRKGGADSWHDNFDFEDADRNIRMLSSRIGEINRIINNCKILILDSLKNDHNRVSLGKTVKFEINGERKCAMIGGYNSNLKGRIAYNSPLGKVLMGQKLGKVINFSFNGTKRTIKILSIQ